MDITCKTRPVILIVEDFDDIRAGMKRCAEKYGYFVLEAADDKEALSIAERFRPQLILTEEELPTLSNLTKRVHQHPDLRRVPMVIINPDKEEGTLYGGIIVLSDFDQLDDVLNSSTKIIN